jgi:pre-mRNA-splicing factor SYF2/beta-D-xylosidase 4
MGRIAAAVCAGVLATHWPAELNPCRGQNADKKWCDVKLSIDDRIKAMLETMSLAEKLGLLSNDGQGVPSMGMQPYQVWSEATHGVGSSPGVRYQGKTPAATNFAFPITTAMSFNRTLWQTTGLQIGKEARAFMNAGNAYSTYWAPVVNLARDPRWGRNIETPGEDPFLSGEYAASWVKGFQENPADPAHVQASACCKHYVANEMDHTSQAVPGIDWTRNTFDATVPMQDLLDSYLVPFKACVEKGRVTSLMCSYNAVNGVPSCANDWLLQTKARDEWHFDGYITSDCDADNDVFFSHHYTKTPEEAVRDVLKAGTDVDCGGFVNKYVQSALDKGLVSEQDIDARIGNLLRVRMRLGHFDPVSPLDRIDPSVACSAESQAIAREGPTQSATLLKNEQNTLPLAAGGDVAVIGILSNASRNTAAYYGPHSVCGGNYWTIADAVAPYSKSVSFAAGVQDPMTSNQSDIPAAAKLAARADDVVLVLGTDLSAAREGHDATSISLPAGQQALAKAVLASAKKPVTIVLITAVPLDISDLLADARVGAVLHAGHPASQVLGIGDLLFGKRVPAGRMVQMVYPKSYADEVSIFDFNMRPGPSAWPRPDCQAAPCANGTNPGRTYRFFTGRPVVPFGFGLSYTSFRYEAVATASSITVGQTAKPLVVRVTNQGEKDADEVVLGFSRLPNAGKDGAPLQTLFDFERVFLKAGEAKEVTLHLDEAMLTHVDTAGARHHFPGEHEVWFGVEAEGMGFARTAVTVVEQPTASIVV